MPLSRARAHHGLDPGRRPVSTRARQRLAPLHADPEQGSSIVETVFVMPLLILLLFTGIQVALWYDARSVCTAAATAGASAAAGSQTAPGTGTHVAQGYLAGPAGSSVLDPAVSEQDGTTVVSVTCSGHAQSLVPVPGLALSFTRTATAPKERWVTP